MSVFELTYYETYKKTYEVDAETREEAEEKLIDDLCEGREKWPDECYHSGFCDVTENDKELAKKICDCCSDGYDDEELRESTEEDLLAELLEIPENSALRAALKYLCDRIEELESKENLE